tara:strand:+ start:511 stop:957 length:447 start_codon:yes stop_codon:yes gene_type:complete
MASGFLDVASTLTVSATAQGSNNWGRVLINTPKDLSMPTGMVQWSHLELILLDATTAGGTTHTAKIFLSWDDGGDEICAGPSSEATMVAGRADTDRYMCVFELYPHSPTIPSNATVDKIYLWIQTANFTDTTPDVIRARLHWHELSKG